MRERGCLPRRVIVCCSDGQAADAGELADVIQKPFPFDRLLKAVFGAGGHRQRLSSGVFPRMRRRASAKAAHVLGAAPIAPEETVALPARSAAVRTPRRAAQGRRDRE